jgi:hypothetical protein
VTWLRLLKAMVIVAAALAAWLRNRDRLEAIAAEAIAGNLRGALDEIAKADGARDGVRGASERLPGGLRDDDGFRRPD